MEQATATAGSSKFRATQAMTSRAGAFQPSSAAPASARALSSSWERQLPDGLLQLGEVGNRDGIAH